MELLSSDRLPKVTPEEVQTAQSLHASIGWVRKVIKNAFLRKNPKRPLSLQMEKIFEILIRIGFDILINMHFQNIQRDGTISENNIMKVSYVKSCS